MQIDQETTSIEEVIRRIHEGTFYDDYDWASGPALRAIDRLYSDMEDAMIARDEAGFLGTSAAETIRRLSEELQEAQKVR